MVSSIKRELDTRRAKVKLEALVANLDDYTPLEFASAMYRIVALTVGIDDEKGEVVYGDQS